jgi:hypothetical protein
MSRSNFGRWALCFLFPCVGRVTLAQTQEEAPPAKSDETVQPPDQDEWTGLAAVNEHHKRLQTLVGKWNLEISVPNAPEGGALPNGTAEYKAILGGRFVTEEVKCNLGNMPFEWFGIYGYDNLKQKYTGTWADTLGTAMETAIGESDSAGKVLSFVGESPETGTYTMKFRWILDFSEPDQVNVRMLEIGADGSETPQMSMKMTRAN